VTVVSRCYVTGYAEGAGLTSASDADYCAEGWIELPSNDLGALLLHKDTDTDLVYLSGHTPDGKWHVLAGPVA
jgi:hypothetical protein